MVGEYRSKLGEGEVMSFGIYYLIDPKDQRVRYVGFSQNPEKRYETHVLQSFACRTHKETWIYSLVKQNLLPTLSVRCIVQCADEAKRVEIALIAVLKTRGIDLTNGTRGGDGSAGFKWSEENYRKHKAWYEAHKHLPNPLKGRKQTPNHVEATKAANTPELLARRGAAIKAGWARRNGAPTKKKNRPLGRPSNIFGKRWKMSDESRTRMINSWTPARRAAHSERMKGNTRGFKLKAEAK